MAKAVKTEQNIGYICDNVMNDGDIVRQIMPLYTRGNAIIKPLKSCTDDFRIHLFNSYCTHLYLCDRKLM